MNKGIKHFIEEEKAYLASQQTGIDWTSVKWNCSDWLFHRGDNKSITFTELKRGGDPLPYPFDDFCKSMVVHLRRTKGVEFVAIHKYLIECRRLYIVMKERNETSPEQLTRWHFEQVVQSLKDESYKNLYDASASLKVIAEVIDRKKISNVLLEFHPDAKPSRSAHELKSISTMESDELRKATEKLPSYEAMMSYAICTNNPINADEEILLRTIDLLIATGQRGNEVALVPIDCWVEKEQRSRSGKLVTDTRGNPILKIGIKYYAEKKFTDRVHWLADQDIPFAKRAVDRLIELTKEARSIAKWQEENPSRIWDVAPTVILKDDQILNYIGFATHFNLHAFLKRNKVFAVKSELDRSRQNKNLSRYKKSNYYLAGDVEKLLYKKFKGEHEQLKVQHGDRLKGILNTSQLLTICFEGSLQFKRRGDFRVKVCPRRITVRDINEALGSVPGMESIFERRKLSEANGDKIVMTSHQPRHWRNTLYELAGMSNVQQALAMGRQRLDQNPTYQHTSLLERTQLHRDFLGFRSPQEKAQFLHEGIREKRILGELTQIYHEVRLNRGSEAADTFLRTHATAIHVTPFGGCTHDFSQAPCPKHLQCWNGCGHLHRTNTPGEAERIKEQIDLSEVVLKSMKADSDGEYGADVWVKDLETKIDNMQKALDIKPADIPVKVFPEGKQFTIAFEERKGSSV